MGSDRQIEQNVPVAEYKIIDIGHFDDFLLCKQHQMFFVFTQIFLNASVFATAVRPFICQGHGERGMHGCKALYQKLVVKQCPQKAE
jgi:hypothetical protein